LLKTNIGINIVLVCRPEDEISILSKRTAMLHYTYSVHFEITY